jgi:hypothetical protein
MPISNLDIARSAHLFIQLHGDKASARARPKGRPRRRRYLAAHHRGDRRARRTADRGAALTGKGAPIDDVPLTLGELFTLK